MSMCSRTSPHLTLICKSNLHPGNAFELLQVQLIKTCEITPFRRIGISSVPSTIPPQFIIWTEALRREDPAERVQACCPCVILRRLGVTPFYVFLIVFEGRWGAVPRLGIRFWLHGKHLLEEALSVLDLFRRGKCLNFLLKCEVIVHIKTPESIHRSHFEAEISPL